MLMGRKIMLVTSSLALLACQGCVGTVMTDEYASAPVMARDNDVFVSEGIRLATEGAFAGNVGLTAERPVNAARSNLLLDQSSQVGPVASTSVSIVSGESTRAPWRDVYTVSDPKDIFQATNWSGAEALRSLQGTRDAVRLIQPSVGKKDFSAAFAFGATDEQTGLGFDLNLVPSVSYQQEGEFRTRRVGAEIRLGWDFDQRGSQAVADSWYVFAGTEGEALIWEAGEYGLSNVTGAMALRDQVTVGDLQAGVSVQRGAGQLSLSYIRREVHWGDRNGSATENEDFAGISFTLKR